MEKIIFKKSGEERTLLVDKTDTVSDGYHTFGELYDHRITLFIALAKVQQCIAIMAKLINEKPPHMIWRSKKHHADDKPIFEGWFAMGIDTDEGKQISYHLPLDRWEETKDFVELPEAPKWDGHTQEDVLDRLKKL